MEKTEKIALNAIARLVCSLFYTKIEFTNDRYKDLETKQPLDAINPSLNKKLIEDAFEPMWNMIRQFPEESAPQLLDLEAFVNECLTRYSNLLLSKNVTLSVKQY